MVDDVYEKELKRFQDKNKSYKVKLENGDTNVKPPVLVERKDIKHKIKIGDIS